MMHKLSALLLLSFVAGSFQFFLAENYLKSSKCDELYSHGERNIEKILLIKDLPKTFEDVEDYCKIANENFAIFKQFTNECLESFTKQVVSVFTKSLKKAIRYICKNDAEKQKAQQALECVDDTSSGQWKECTHAANRQFHYLANNSSLDKIWANLCCMQNSLTQCINTLTLRPECEKKQINPRKTFLDLISILLKDIFDLGCGKFKNIEDCLLHNPEGVRMLEQVAKSTKKVDGPILIAPLLSLLPRLTA